MVNSWSGRILAVLATALGTYCQVASADSSTLTLADGGAKAWITTSTNAQRDTRLEIKVDVGGRGAQWVFDDLSIDPEPVAAAAEIVPLKRGKVLLVHTYSGGAGCCWSLLAFDLKQLKPVGRLSSQIPIRVAKHERNCELGAYAVPDGVDLRTSREPDQGRLFYCFSGEHFVRVEQKIRPASTGK